MSETNEIRIQVVDETSGMGRGVERPFTLVVRGQRGKRRYFLEKTGGLPSS